MKKLTKRQRRNQLKSIAALPDKQIDTSDIPELTEEDFARGVRGGMYRPVKKPVTMRLDADVIAWLKKDGRGYQTKANALLRRAMVFSSMKKKRVSARERAGDGNRKVKSVRWR